ncbi:aspartyl-phosphate phosphatase Spo0E family protein [Lentibacillus sp. CBA3610]|uniref:aspartyl-phosphate phosphatase Spo0E family protein n=1 Tax=Lentibacillus sp. CBA3610 TaxID=2518176 RepID=UPI0015957516|nr:aspartyl-phosphate phosphatase Spo0E family protein [Lentibacillus sp. CBA3610]QKY68892.1 aspartyl-phosphate phosphatase Spo0E family protein [Lentibacillus sp. CBA3610]
MCATDKLLERIEFLRNKMTDIALKKGFTSTEAITTSQELDKLLNLYESMKQTKSRKKVE